MHHPRNIHFELTPLDAQRQALLLPSFAQISRRHHRGLAPAVQGQARLLLRQATQELAAARAAGPLELRAQDSALRSTWAGELLYAAAPALHRAGFDAAAYARAGGDLLALGATLGERGLVPAQVQYAAVYYPDDQALAWWTFHIACDPTFLLTVDAVYPLGLAPTAAAQRLAQLRRAWFPGLARGTRCRRGTPPGG